MTLPQSNKHNHSPATLLSSISCNLFPLTNIQKVFIQMLLERKSSKVKKGWMAVEVGLEEEGGATKFVIPISYLYHSLFNQLLDLAHEVYGYHISGPLRLPCSTDEFLHLRWQIERENNKNHHHHHQHLPTSLSFHTC